MGWFDKAEGKERRVLREVDPEKAIELCTDVFGKPMVLDCQEDVHAFMVYGGQAIIKKDICEKYMPWFLEEFIVDSEELHSDLY